MGKHQKAETKAAKKKNRTEMLKKKKKVTEFEARIAKAVSLYDAQTEKNIELACWKDGKKDGEKLVNRKTLVKYGCIINY